MANNEDVNKANQGAPAADIPNLKAKEKERKKAGAAWGGAKPGGGSFSGATGGTVARSAASAASASGGAGAAGVGAASGTFFGFSGGIANFLAAAAGTMLGKLALGLGAALLIGGAGLFAYAALMGGGAGQGGLGVGDLGALSSSMRVRAGGVDRTGYLASKGEIMFDPAKPAGNAVEQKKEETPAEQPAEAVPPAQTADAAGQDAGWNRPGLEHNLSGARLSSSLGGGSFGGKNIFGGNSAANKLGDTMGRFNIKSGEKGRMTPTRSARTGRAMAGSTRTGPKANKAFGQLKVARGASMLGVGSTGAEGASNNASRAFDGGTINTAQTEGGPGSGPDTGPVTTPSETGGGGAPDVTAPDVNPNIGLQGQQTAAMIAAIAAMAKQAGDLKKRGQMLMWLGAALMALFWVPLVGGYLFVMGAVIFGVGMMMTEMSKTMMGMAKAMSAALAQQNTDQNQNRINNYCIDRAYEGTPPESCNPPADVTNVNEHDSARSAGVVRHENMIRETSRVEGDNGTPTP